MAVLPCKDISLHDKPGMIAFVKRLFDELNPHGFERTMLIQSVGQQIEKDLNLSGINFNTHFHYLKPGYWQELFNLLISELRRDPEKIRAFLYRADVDEKLVVEILSKNPDLEMTWLIRAIIEREFFKVVNRKKYESDSGEPAIET